LASGASESEIFIWDLNRLNSPMTPGQKSQPVDDVRCVAWNKQVRKTNGATTFSTKDLFATLSITVSIVVLSVVVPEKLLTG